MVGSRALHFTVLLFQMQTAVNINLQIVFENLSKDKINVKLVRTEKDGDDFRIFKEIISNMSLFDVELDVIECNDFINVNINNETVDVIVFADFWSNEVSKSFFKQKI